MFINAYSKATGRKQRVPAHFMTIPSLSRGLTLDDPNDIVAPERPARSAPKSAWVAFALASGVERAAALSKAQIIAALDALASDDPASAEAESSTDDAQAASEDLTPDPYLLGHDQKERSS